MRSLILILVLTLAGCGADGAPETPVSKSRVSVTGEAVLGVVVR